MNHLSHKLKCRHVNYSYQIHKCCSGHETLIESIKYMPTSWTICSFYFSMLARFGHITWPIIIAALDTGFKMCHWSVIDVFYNILSSVLLSTGMCSWQYTARVSVHINTLFSLLFTRCISLIQDWIFLCVTHHLLTLFCLGKRAWKSLTKKVSRISSSSAQNLCNYCQQTLHYAAITRDLEMNEWFGIFFYSRRS